MIEINRYLCGYCGTCVAVCPSGVIDLIDTWIEIGEGCKACEACVKVCPVGALSLCESDH